MFIVAPGLVFVELARKDTSSIGVIEKGLEMKMNLLAAAAASVVMMGASAASAAVVITANPDDPNVIVDDSNGPATDTVHYIADGLYDDFTVYGTTGPTDVGVIVTGNENIKPSNTGTPRPGSSPRTAAASAISISPSSPATASPPSSST